MTVARYETLTMERRGDVAELTLTRPDLLNRVDDRAHHELISAFGELRDTEGLRAVVFASSGKVFSAGGDFELMLAGNADLKRRQVMAADGRRLLATLLEVPVPIVVALHGDAIGLGATLVLACEAVVAHPGAAIADTHVAIGLVAGDGGCLVWPQAAGMLRAKRYLLTGDRIAGEDAYRAGLITDLVESPEEVLPAARRLAERIAALAPVAIRGTKQALNQVMRQRFEEVMDVGLVAEMVSMGTDDLREAIAAFKERRAPRYQGR